MNLLLLSNSTNFGDPYLHHAAPLISNFLNRVTDVLFIPYAGVTVTYDDYEKKVQTAMKNSDVIFSSIHHERDPSSAIEKAQAIAVGGGNTFQLLATLQRKNLLHVLRQKVISGCPYVGWSAGSNIAGPTICTTNDMPIVEPTSFKALNLVPFQINPHFTEAVILNHGGESRTDRLREYLQVNQDKEVVCLPEGSWFSVENGSCSFGGNLQSKVLRFNAPAMEAKAADFQSHFDTYIS